jgi:hypothetical protein
VQHLKDADASMSFVAEYPEHARIGFQMAKAVLSAPSHRDRDEIAGSDVQSPTDRSEIKEQRAVESHKHICK